MTIQEGFTRFHERLDMILNNFGFYFDRSKHEARKGTDRDWCKVIFDIHKMYDFTYDVPILLVVRNNQIQSVRGAAKAEKKETDYTINLRPASLSTYYYPGKRNWQIITDPGTKLIGSIINFEHTASVDNWLEGFSQFMEDIGYHFFNRFNSIDDYDQWFTQTMNNEQQGIHSGLPWNDCCAGVATAWLNKNPSFENIYNTWWSIFEQAMSTKSRNDLRELKAFIDSNEVEEWIKGTN